MRRLILTLTVGALVLSAAACSTAGNSPSGGSGGTNEGDRLEADVVRRQRHVHPGAGRRVRRRPVRRRHGCGFERLQRLQRPRGGDRVGHRGRPVLGDAHDLQGPAADVETAYLNQLAKAATFTATADALTMFDAAGKASLVYAAGPANPLVGDWNVTGYNNGNAAVTSPAVGSTLTATFSGQFRVRISGLQHLFGWIQARWPQRHDRATRLNPEGVRSSR